MRRDCLFTHLAAVLVFALAAFSQTLPIGVQKATAGAQGGITGAWEAKDVAFAPWTFNLQANGAKLTGTASQGAADSASGVTRGSGPAASRRSPVQGAQNQ